MLFTADSQRRAFSLDGNCAINNDKAILQSSLVKFGKTMNLNNEKKCSVLCVCECVRACV